MSLTRTDVDLAASLPLRLTRTHLSNYRAGGWFGTSWASTLDQHLEIDERGIVYAGPDGQLLSYPHPDNDGPALPEHGPLAPAPQPGQRQLPNPPTRNRAHPHLHTPARTATWLVSPACACSTRIAQTVRAPR
ncbi:DUF6531 domain-containing protein [Streptomyces sp. V3I7]|uniref:DUF6531 domain-containing protein n=1 Tax=Streptomyces sp. V3I7 TaxID=3042278 RepID=UPI0027D8C879|nr:DUF6531 domain-containing protein [Streptomyces sp. V3I7]